MGSGARGWGEGHSGLDAVDEVKRARPAKSAKGRELHSELVVEIQVRVACSSN